MLFAEALDLLKSGKNVSRDAWAKEDGYLVLLEGMKHVWKILTHPGPNAGNHIFRVDELSATDWCEYNAAKFDVPAPCEPTADVALEDAA